MREEVDITGLMAQPVEGWQERVALLCTPDAFGVDLFLWKPELYTAEERKRLKPKLELVKRFAQYMAAGMLKGTLKYASDTYSIEQWMAHMIGEGADQANYQALLFDAWRKAQ